MPKCAVLGHVTCWSTMDRQCHVLSRLRVAVSHFQHVAILWSG